jgi:ribonuclease D
MHRPRLETSPPMFADTPLVMVEDAATLKEVARTLSKAPAIGVDTEGDSFYSYREKVCLLQISDLHTDFVIDPLAVSDLSALGPIMADRDIVKIFHGADYDVVCMKRDFGFEVRNLFDTMLASQLTNLPRVGLADIIGQFFGHTIEKKYQRHDWSKRPLYNEHIDYARGDSHWLPALREILMRRLEDVGRTHILDEECEILEERTWVGKPFDPNTFYDMKGARGLSDDDFRILRHLYVYRDQEARKLDRPVFKTISDKDLISVAQARPTNERELDEALPGRQGLKRRHSKNLLDLVQNGMHDDTPLPNKKKKAAPSPRKTPGRLRGKAADRGFELLKSWRNKLMKTTVDLPHAALISNGGLKEIVRARPATLEEFRAVDGVRNWQADEYGEVLVALLADFDENA